MSALRVGSTCPGCGLPHWTLTLVDFARGSCGRCGYHLGRDVEAERKLAALVAERTGCE